MMGERQKDEGGTHLVKSTLSIGVAVMVFFGMVCDVVIGYNILIRNSESICINLLLVLSFYFRRESLYSTMSQLNTVMLF
jgi:hypothetical protein